MVQYSQEFRQDFYKWHGRPPMGEFGHWCSDWDELPIDEFCQECLSCGCFENEPKYQQAKDNLEDSSFYFDDDDIEYEDPIAW